MPEIEKEKRFFEFMLQSDQDFYDTYLVNLTEEELERFMKENPDFAEGINWEDTKCKDMNRKDMMHEMKKQEKQNGDEIK